MSENEVVDDAEPVGEDVEPVRPLEPTEAQSFDAVDVSPDSLEERGIDPAGVVEKEYSYRQLVDAGVSEETADALRRHFSLPWSFQSDGDLDRRSETVSGLVTDERAWIAASADETWQGFEDAGKREIPGTADRPTERPYPKPTPVTAVTGVSEKNADRLAEAGIISAERLATIHAGEVAAVLDLDVLHVRTWRHNARELIS